MANQILTNIGFNRQAIGPAHLKIPSVQRNEWIQQMKWNQQLALPLWYDTKKAMLCLQISLNDNENKNLICLSLLIHNTICSKIACRPRSLFFFTVVHCFLFLFDAQHGLFIKNKMLFVWRRLNFIYATYWPVFLADNVTK